MKKIDKKIKGLSIELDKSIKLNELDEVILDFEKNTDEKQEDGVEVAMIWCNVTRELDDALNPWGCVKGPIQWHWGCHHEHEIRSMESTWATPMG